MASIAISSAEECDELESPDDQTDICRPDDAGRKKTLSQNTPRLRQALYGTAVSAVKTQARRLCHKPEIVSKSSNNNIAPTSHNDAARKRII